MAFAVYGYMNRGNHEGEVGVGIYYFDINKNAIEEKAFIPSTKSFAIAEDELGKMVYYNHGQEMLYVLAEERCTRSTSKMMSRQCLRKNWKRDSMQSPATGILWRIRRTVRSILPQRSG